MSDGLGDLNPALTTAVKRVANGDFGAVFFSPHAFEREEERGIDHLAVRTCLRKGKVYGPEWINGELRANVIHRGLHVRVAIGGLGFDAESDWSELSAIVVCTVMAI